MTADLDAIRGRVEPDANAHTRLRYVAGIETPFYETEHAIISYKEARDIVHDYDALQTDLRTLLAHVAEVEQKWETAQSYQRAAVKHKREAEDSALMHLERAEKAEAERDTLRDAVARVREVAGAFVSSGDREGLALALRILALTEPTP